LSILSIGIAIVAVDYVFVNRLWSLTELIYVVLLSLPFGMPYLPFPFQDGRRKRERSQTWIVEQDADCGGSEELLKSGVRRLRTRHDRQCQRLDPLKPA
jgi:hypothetical protein